MSMARNTPLAILFLLVTPLLAGCLGGDDPVDTGDDGDDGADDPNTGAVTGRVLTTDLIEIADARIVLSTGGDLVQEARSDDAGNFEIRGVEPGTYRLQVSGPCCHEDVRALEIQPGETVQADVQLEPLSDDDLKMPYVEKFEWTGFIACGVTVGALGGGVSGEFCEDVDENSNVTHLFDLKEGVETVTAGLVWEATGGLLGETLGIGMHTPTCSGGICDVGDSSETYGYTGGSSPVILQVRDPGETLSFDDIEDTREARFMVLPEFGIDLFYQQEFTVYYHVHYHEPASEDHDPIPDL